MPGYSRRGNTLTLHCKFDLEGDRLYNVKWYKGIKEFYRYVLADAPPKQVFDLPGVTVDVSGGREGEGGGGLRML